MGLVTTAEVIERDIKSDGGFKVRQLLTESVSEPRKAAKVHSDR